MTGPAFHRGYVNSDSEAEQNLALLRHFRAQYETAAPEQLWLEYGVTRHEVANRYSILTGSQGFGTDVVFCFHDDGESIADAECYGFGHLCYATGLTVLCPFESDPSVLPDILRELKKTGVSFRRVFVFGKGAGAVIALRCASLYSNFIDAVCSAHAPPPLRETASASIPSHIPVLYLADTEMLPDVRPHRHYHIEAEGLIWAVLDCYSISGTPLRRVISSPELHSRLTAATVCFTYGFFSGETHRPLNKILISKGDSMDKRINNISTHYLIHADVHWQTSLADDRFDPVYFKNTEYGRNIMERKRLYGMYWYDQMHPDILAHWKEYGVVKELYDWSEDETLTLRERNHWAVYTPENISPDEKLPLIYLIHGGGEDAFSAETYGFCELIYSQRYMVICPQSGDPDDFVRILTTAKEKGYPIDERRVYLAGFSGGQVACTRIAWTYPELIAGCVCMSGVQSLNQIPSAELPEKFKQNPNLQVPYMCLGGDNDGGDHFPPHDQLACDVYNTWMRDIAKVHNFEPLTKEESGRLMKESPSTVQRVLGVNTQKDYLTYLEGTYWYIGDYFDRFGTVIARNIQGVGIPHQPSASYACFAWSFLKKFSRDLDTGSLVYARPTTDFRRRWIKITYDDQGNPIYENTGSHAAGALGGGLKPKKT